MKLRTALLAGTAVLVAAIIAATVIAIVILVDRSERTALRADLDRSHTVFHDLLEYRHSALRSDCRVVANEPRLRALVATKDITRETVIGVVAELRASLGSDLFFLTDPSGTLISDALDPTADGHDLSANPVIAGVLKSGEGSAVLISGGKPYQAQGCRVEFGAQTAGIIAIGRIFDDNVAQAIYRQTGSTLAVAVDGQQVAASVLHDGTRSDLGAIARDATSTIAEVDVKEGSYVVTGGALPGYAGKRTLTYAIMRSLDEALAPGRRLIYTVIVIAALAFAGSLVLAFALSRRLSRPVDELVAFTHKVSRGTLSARAEAKGMSEVKALATAMNHMVEEIEKSRDQLAEKERLEKELEIATRIQTSMLPVSFDVHRMDIAAKMVPAAEVGGDYYDILPVKDGCWIGIGDVAGHGLTAGLEMMMVQSVVSALVRENPEATPKHHLKILNQVIYDNVRNRLHQDEHVTLTLMHCAEGNVTFAGAHEDIILCRVGATQCERIATPGPWLGAMRDITRVTQDSTLELAPGDLMVLYSDGITESRGADGKEFGIDRLCDTIFAARNLTVEEIRDRIFEAVASYRQDDDRSVVVLRRVAE
ncbi:MAG: SpoIIE family protein phosphatase [Kofleriaceae bacterium]|nr:SpoIIE family protein phosphatase [Kofleriaceae bacterium]